MVLTRSQHENTSKEVLIQELTVINSSFVNDINSKLSDLSERFNEFTKCCCVMEQNPKTTKKYAT